MSDMRKYINLFESEQIQEASWISNALTKLKASGGNSVAQGQQERNELAETLSNNFGKWIGRTNREGTLKDIQEFLQTVGFTNEEINQFTQKTIEVLSKQFKPGETANDFILNNNDINNIMNQAAAFSFNNEFVIKGEDKSNSQKQTDKNIKNKSPANNNTLNFNDKMINSLIHNNVGEDDIKNLTYDSKQVKFENFDNEAKEKLAAIAYAMLRYTKGANIQ